MAGNVKDIPVGRDGNSCDADTVRTCQTPGFTHHHLHAPMHISFDEQKADTTPTDGKVRPPMRLRRDLQHEWRRQLVLLLLLSDKATLAHTHRGGLRVHHGADRELVFPLFFLSGIVLRDGEVSYNVG